MGRGLCLIEKDQINCPKFGHVEIKIVPDSDSDKTVKVWVYGVHIFFRKRRYGEYLKRRICDGFEEDFWENGNMRLEI